jgi:hypothetical protein
LGVGELGLAQEYALIHRVLRLAAFLLITAMCLLAQRPAPRPNLTDPLKMGRADVNTFVGLVSDSTCGPRHKLRDKSAEECTRACQRGGASFALVAGERIYKLKGDTNDVAVLAGQKVKVTGTLQGDTITVNAIQPTM